MLIFFGNSAVMSTTRFAIIEPATTSFCETFAAVTTFTSTGKAATAVAVDSACFFSDAFDEQAIAVITIPSTAKIDFKKSPANLLFPFVLMNYFGR